jgi:diguanylate cyclase (GGDEF)-like protein
MRQIWTIARTRLALCLLAVGIAVVVLVIGAETWRARARYHELAHGGARTAGAADLVAAADAYTQGIADYLDSPDPERQLRVPEMARDLAARLEAFVEQASAGEDGQWGRQVRAAAMGLAADGGAVVAASDRLRANHAHFARRLRDTAHAVSGRPDVARALLQLEVATARYVDDADAATGRRFAEAVHEVNNVAERQAPSPEAALAREMVGDALALGREVEIFDAARGAFVSSRERTRVSLTAPLRARLGRDSGLADEEVERSLRRLSIAAVLLPIGLIVGVGGLLIARARFLRPLRARYPTLDVHLAAGAGAPGILATDDDVTGLVSRAGFNEVLAGAIESARHRGESLAVLLLDLDGFKAVNDTLGHEQGDHLLRAVAHRLRSLCRGTDVVARLGGDEFGILLRKLGDPHRTAEVAERCLSGLLAPVELRSRSVTPRASIGIAIYPDDAHDAIDLLRAADTAMYAAKHAGKHRYQFYDRRMTHDVEEQMTLEAELRAAIEGGEFKLLYQPKVSLSTGRLVGVEALVRWPRRGHGLVGPDAFIPAAERLGLIGALGDWVLHTACAQAAAWRRADLPAFGMAVNISPSHFGAPGFVDGVERVLADTGLDARDLEIELTESVMSDAPLLGEASRRLRRLGARLAIDDFGAGFSSLTALKHTSIDTLKIDRQFVQGLVDDPGAPLLLGTVLGMASGLELTTVAEGVETLHEVRVLQSFGCHQAQGYYFSPPVPADSIPALARAAFFVRTAAG